MEKDCRVAANPAASILQHLVMKLAAHSQRLKSLLEVGKAMTRTDMEDQGREPFELIGAERNLPEF